MTNYWLIKSEPATWSWAQQKAVIQEPWNGVRNHQANNYLKQMQPGDLAFFYHSGDERQVVGVVEVVTSYYPDPSEPRFGMVDVKFKADVQHPVTLTAIKQEPMLANMLLLRQSRLSIMPLQENEWVRMMALSQKEDHEK